MESRRYGQEERLRRGQKKVNNVGRGKKRISHSVGNRKERDMNLRSPHDGKKSKSSGDVHVGVQ